MLLQVMNILSAAQANSPLPVVEALGRVLDILRTTELYSPHFMPKDDDPHANDLVGGLVAVSWPAQIRGPTAPMGQLPTWIAP